MCNCNLHCMKPHIYIWAIHNDKSTYIYILYDCGVLFMYLYVISAIGMHMQMFHVSAVSTTPDEQKNINSTHICGILTWGILRCQTCGWLKHYITYSSKHQYGPMKQLCVWSVSNTNVLVNLKKLCKWYTSTNLYPSVIKKMAPHTPTNR